MSLPDLKIRLTADDASANRALDQARSKLRDVKTEAKGAAGGMQDVSRSSGAMRASIQNAAFQVGDFAVQVSAGTSAVRAMSMQLPQLLGAFGVFGAVAGAAFAALAPLVAKLFEGGDAADEQAAKLEGLSGSLSSMRGQISGLGDLQERLNSLQRAQAGASAAGASAVIANTQKEFDARKQLIEVERTLLTLRSQDAIQALNNLRQQQDAARNAMSERLRNLGPGATRTGIEDAEGYAGGGVQYGDIVTAIGQDSLDQMRDRRVQIQRLEAELALVEIAADEAKQALDGVFTAPGDPTGDGSGGGSGGGGGGRSSRGRSTPMMEAISQHAEALQNLVDMTRGSLGDASGAWGDYFDDLVTRTGSTNKRLLAMAKAFGAASALIDAWEAHNKVLKDPMLPWWARIASAAQVLASGLGAVNAIRGVNMGGAGGGGGAGSTAAAAAPNQPLEAIVRLQGPFASALAGEIGTIFDMLREEAGDRGLSPRVVGIA